MKQALLRASVLAIFILPLCVFAQKQYTFNENKSVVSLIIDKEMKMAGTVAEAKKGQPLLESKLYGLAINMDTVGVWVTSDKVNIWKLNIEVPGAAGFIVSFKDFYLPSGSHLYVYNKSDLNKATVYSHNDNPKGGSYSLENLLGDNVVLEYVASGQNERPRLLFADVGYKYTANVGTPLDNYGASENCMVNVNCPQGSLWQEQKKGVLRLRMFRGGNTYLCSGSLVNNTNKDKTPYVLSAYHCFEYMKTEEISQTEFIFEYESPSCENEMPTYKYHKGAIPLVLLPIDKSSDGALLQLSAPIPSGWDVYYNGWDKTNDGRSVTGGAIIHHPMGDIKKITLYNKNLTSGTWSAATNAHWIVNYALGATDRGSSGAPIFNQSGLIVGTLTGGTNKCTAPTLPDYYGKFWYHWNQDPNTDLHMSKYLDPLNTGVMRLEGINALTDEPGPNPDNQPEVYAYIQEDVLYIHAKSTLKKIRVINLSGWVVYSKAEGFDSSTFDIPVSDWRPGVYIVCADMEGQSTKTIRIIK
jgi:hypothetical protein